LAYVRYALDAEAVAGEPRGALARDQRQASAAHVVRAEGADAEARREARGPELHARAGLDVAREEADDGVAPCGERRDELGDPRHHPHPASVAQARLELSHVYLKALGCTRLYCIVQVSG